MMQTNNFDLFMHFEYGTLIDNYHHTLYNIRFYRIFLFGILKKKLVCMYVDIMANSMPNGVMNDFFF